jgi:polyhydroxyalkanoate synthesis regulator phasin
MQLINNGFYTRFVEEKAGELAEDLVKHGFINPVSD